MKQWILIALTGLCSFPAMAEQFQTIKDVEVHYSAFNSTFITPKVAKSYQLKRSGYSAILNISLLDNSQVGNSAISGSLSGQVKNLIGQTKQLEFKQVKEGQAIYYLAQFPITNEETFTFNIDVDAGNKGKGQLKFTQKFYVEE